MADETPVVTHAEYFRHVGNDIYFYGEDDLVGMALRRIPETPWGTLTINFADCDNAMAMLDGVDGQQTMNMVKLAGLQDSRLNCH